MTIRRTFARVVHRPHVGRALLIVWPAVLLAIVGARIAGTRPKLDEEQLNRFATFFAVNLTVSDTFRVGTGGSAAAVFVDPRCHVCTEDPDRLVSALQLYARDRYMVVPMSHRPDIAELMIRLGYPREMDLSS